MAEITADKLRRRFYIVPAANLMASKTFPARKSAAVVFHRLMALETSVMCVLPVRNGKTNAFAARFMAGRTILFAVVGVAESDSETDRVRYFLMTFAAIRKSVCAEGFLPVVASRATVRIARVHRNIDRRHIVSARRTVTALAILTAVARMAEIKTDIHGFRRNAVRFALLMARRTRTEIFLADLFVGRVTLNTGHVRVHARRNRHTRALRLMTRRAVRFLEMRRMIEFHSEGFQRRKRFHLARFGVRVADRANIVRFFLELLNVTTRTSLMRSKFRFRRLFIRLVTQQTRNGRVPSFVVFECFEIEIRHITKILFGFKRLKRAFGFVDFPDIFRAGNQKIDGEDKNTEQNNQFTQML